MNNLPFVLWMLLYPTLDVIERVLVERYTTEKKRNEYDEVTQFVGGLIRLGIYVVIAILLYRGV